MKHFSWIITLPLLVAVVVFSVNNIGDMALDLWPFGIVVMWPTYLVVLLTFVLGFIGGGIVMWLSAGSTRREARRQRAEARRLQHELDSLRRATEAAKPASPPAPGQLAAGPATPRLPATADG